jgi:hypothetical protein
MPDYIISAPGGAILVPAPTGGGTPPPATDVSRENLLIFGADPTGMASSDAAVDNWLAAVAASGKPGYAPAGIYRIDTAKAVTFARNVRIEGAGAGLTRFVFAAGAGLSITMDKDPRLVDGAGNALFAQYRCAVGAMTLATTGVADADALTVTYGFSQSMTDRGFMAWNLQLVGEDPQVHGWRKGIVGHRLWNPLFDDVNFKGRNEPIFPFSSQTAFELFEPQAPTMTRVNAYHVETALHIHGGQYCEGINVSHFEFVGVRKGIVLGGTPVRAAGTTIHHGHINAYERCIVGNNLRMLNISDILFLKAPWTGYWQGVEMVNCEGLNIHHSRFRGNPASGGGNDCIVLGASTRSSVNNNDGGDFASVGSICILHTMSNYNDVFDNILGTNCTPVAPFNGQLSNRFRNT